MRRLGPFALAITLLLASCAQQCNEDGFDSSIETQTLEGEVVNTRVLVDEFSTNIDVVDLRLDSNGATVQFELSGRPDLIEENQRYQVTVFTDPENPTQTDLPTANLIGPTGCGTPANTVLLLSDDGETAAVEFPSAIPEPPIDLRTFVIGFGIFAALLFVFRHR